MTSVLVTSAPTAPDWPVRGMVSALQRRMIADAVGRLAVRDLPDDLAAIEVDRGDAAVRRLQERQALRRARWR